MPRQVAFRQALEGNVESILRDHDGTEKRRQEPKKCPRNLLAWTLFKIRYSVLAASHFSPNLHARRQNSLNERLGDENSSQRTARDVPSWHGEQGGGSSQSSGYLSVAAH